ncbi:MAG: hypothetical protein N4A31_03165, partial [Rickettsiales bacterium]|nr:hypothetical protein [Rickettsiales bacterium]
AAISADSITGAKISDSEVASEHLAANAVTAAAISADSITGAKISDSVVASEHLAARSVLEAAIGVGTWGAANCASYTIADCTRSDSPSNCATSGAATFSDILNVVGLCSIECTSKTGVEDCISYYIDIA